MGVERRGKNSWRIGEMVATENGRDWIRRTLKYPDTMPEDEQRAAAEIELKRLQVEIADKVVKPAQRALTVRDLADKWEKRHVIPNCSPITQKNYRHMLDKRILPAFGERPINRVSPGMIADFLAELRETPRDLPRKPDNQLARKRTPSDAALLTENTEKCLSDRSVRHYYDTLFSMFSKAVQWEMLRANPVAKVDKPRFKRKPMHFLTDDQAVDLLRKLGNEKDMSFRAAVLLALLGGMRLGEVGELRWSDVSWADGTVDITRAVKYTPKLGAFVGDPKSDAGVRLVTMPAGMMALLEQTLAYQKDIEVHIGDRWRGTGLIVCGWDGARLNHDTPSKQWKKFAVKNGYPDVRFHDLRHSHATLLFASNMDAVTVATRLGHESADTTLRFYAHALRKRDEQSARALQLLFDRAKIPDPK